MSADPTRAVVPDIEGVHEVQQVPRRAPRTTCGYLIYQPSQDGRPDDAEVTCYRCRIAIAAREENQ